MSTQNEFDFLDEDGNMVPSAEDTLMFIGYCLKAYALTNDEPLAIDNELVKELIAQSVDRQTVPAIIVGTKGEAVILEADMRSL